MDYTDFLIQKGYLPEDYGTVLTALINAPVQNGGKTFSVGGKNYTWKSGVLYDAQGKSLGNVPETNSSVDLGKNLLTAMGYKGELFGKTPQSAEKMAIDLGYTGETQHQDTKTIPYDSSKQQGGLGIAGMQQSQQATNGWVDPATGWYMPWGVGEPTTEYIKRTGKQPTSKPTSGSVPSTTNTTGEKQELVWVISPDGLELEMNPQAAQSYLNKGWTMKTQEQKSIDDQIKEQTTTKTEEAAKTEAEKQKQIDDAAIEFAQRGKELGWPQELIDLGVLAIKNYPKGKQFDMDEVINTFNKIKADTIDPYFKELTDIAVKDFTTQKQQLDDARAMELEKERYQAGQSIMQAKEGQEKAGMTFTGKAIETLGKESAYAQTGAVPTPLQTPFGGMFYEGTVPMANRMISTSSKSAYEAAQQKLGREAETMLGTAGTAGLGLTYSPAGVTQSAKLPYQKQQKYASTIQDLIEQQKNKYGLTTENLNKNK